MYITRTALFNLLNALLDDDRYERVLRLDERREVDAEDALDVLHIRYAVGRHFLRALLVRVETAVCSTNSSSESKSCVHVHVCSTN